MKPSDSPFILYITGVSTSGKTTLYERLKGDNSFKDIAFHDIDENGVPTVGREPWRQYRVEELLYQAVGRYKQGQSTIICGITKPHEVVESIYYGLDCRIHFLLLTVSSDLFETRLQERIDEQTASGKFDESFSASGKERTIQANAELARILYNSTSAQKTGRIIDVTEVSKDEIYDQVKTLIADLRDSE